MTFSFVQEKGQVTIPAFIRKKLKMKKGDMIAFVETDKGILLSPREVVAIETLDKIGKILKTKGVILEELMESGREIRSKQLKRIYRLQPA